MSPSESSIAEPIRCFLIAETHTTLGVSVAIMIRGVPYGVVRDTVCSQVYSGYVHDNPNDVHDNPNGTQWWM